MTRENIKRILPTKFLELYRKFRRWERFHKRYKYNKGESFVKEVSVLDTNFKIFINPYKNCCVDDFIAHDGYWEPKISENIIKYLPKGGVFVDVGANIGYHSLFAASLHESRSKIFAFEPQKEVYEMICDSIKENNFSNVKVFNVGLSDRSGSAELNIFEENKGASSLVSGLKHHTGTRKIQIVELKTLDSFKDSIPHADVIKIDVEGFELETIIGAESLIKKSRPVLLVEFSPGLYSVRGGRITERLIEKLEELDYKIYTLSGELLNLREWSKSNNIDTSQIDIVCLPN